MNIFKQLWERYRMGNAIQEAVDSLPSAVCYFTPKGSVKLCNTTMYELYRKLAHKHLKSYADLTEAMERCNSVDGIMRDGNTILFLDGSAWQYSHREVVTSEHRTYIEAVFSDVTELYEKQRELSDQSQQMRYMYADLQAYSGKLLEITREQEILNMKALLHDQMNLGITAIRQILRQNTSSDENTAAVDRFRRAIQILEEEGNTPQDDLSEFLRDAEVSGVHVTISGALPENASTLQLLIAVMREACINAARHADAAELRIVSESGAGAVKFAFTNDGKQPEKEIVPRGGLKDLGKRIEEAGGVMEIRSVPEFVLTVTLPIDELGRKKELQG